MKVREYRFRALVTFLPAAAGAARGYRDGPRTRCIVQPTRRKYLPAVISRGRPSRPRHAVLCVLSIPLADGEAQAFFTPGQRFTIWADARVARTIRCQGLLGYGIIATATAQSPADTVPPARGLRDNASLIRSATSSGGA